MKAWLFIFILVVAGILSILRLLCRIKSIKKGKEKKVREEYAAESVALLLFLAMDRNTLRILVLGLSGRYLSHPQGRIRSDSNCGYY